MIETILNIYKAFNEIILSNPLSKIGLLLVVSFLGSKIIQRFGIPQVVGNFLITLHNLKGFLTKLFNTDLVIYAVLALLLIVMQGALLDGLTSFC